MVVVIKLIEPRIDEAPARCNDRMAKSTDGPLWAMFPASGGYTVHPVPAPLSTNIDKINNRSERTKSQNLKLFSRGKAMSDVPSIKGSNQFPKPPIKIGITKKRL